MISRLASWVVVLRAYQGYKRTQDRPLWAAPSHSITQLSAIVSACKITLSMAFGSRSGGYL